MPDQNEDFDLDVDVGLLRRLASVANKNVEIGIRTRGLPITTITTRRMAVVGGMDDSIVGRDTTGRKVILLGRGSSIALLRCSLL